MGYLAMVRQGLGIQNESHCILQLGFENTTKGVKRMQDQIEELVENFLGIKDDVGSVASEVRGAQTKHDEMATHIVENISLVEDLQKRLETVILDVQGFRVLKSDLHNNDARLERELRELRRDRLSIVSKLEEELVPNACSQHSSQNCWSGDWPKRKSPLQGKMGGMGPGSFNNSGSSGCDFGSGQQPRRICRLGSGQLQQLDDAAHPHGSGGNVEELSERARLPLLMPGISRSADVTSRLRLS